MTLVKVTEACALLVLSVSANGAAASSGVLLSSCLSFPTHGAGLMVSKIPDTCKDRYLLRERGAMSAVPEKQDSSSLS